MLNRLTLTAIPPNRVDLLLQFHCYSQHAALTLMTASSSAAGGLYSMRANAHIA